MSPEYVMGRDLPMLRARRKQITQHAFTCTRAGRAERHKWCGKPEEAGRTIGDSVQSIDRMSLP